MSTLVTTNLKHGGAASPNIVLNSGGDVTFGGDVTLGTSVLAAPTGDAPSYTCRAWVNFNGTGTVAIRASGNVSSITDNGVGDYTVNFTTAMPDVNYATNITTGGLPTSTVAWLVGAANTMRVSPFQASPTTTTMRFTTSRSLTSDTTDDAPWVFVSIFR